MGFEKVSGEAYVSLYWHSLLLHSCANASYLIVKLNLLEIYLRVLVFIVLIASLDRRLGSPDGAPGLGGRQVHSSR